MLSSQTHDELPAALVRVASAQDVAEALRYAAKHELRIAPQSTGHNAGPIQGLEAGLAPLSGSSRDVGIAGYSLGGGMGWRPLPREPRDQGVVTEAAASVQPVPLGRRAACARGNQGAAPTSA